MAKFCYLTVLISAWLCCDGYLIQVMEHDNWDYLVFSQAWPVTSCLKNLHNRTDPTQECIFPRNPLQWTIHGLWPNRINGDNPSFCNRSATFDENKIEDIRMRLDEFWPNLMKDKTEASLWKHEWEKHGTCANDLESLNDERKYFQKGLDLYAAYNMTALLPSLSVFPERIKEYSVVHISNLIQNSLSKAPYVECDNMKGAHYLAEIRLCFDRNLQLMDCLPSHSHYGTHKLTNCPENSTILYPRDVKFGGLH